MIPKLNKTYKMIFPKAEVTATLAQIDTSSIFPAVYVFKYISGDNSLCGQSGGVYPDNCFHLPVGLLSRIEFTEIDDDTAAYIDRCEKVLIRIKTNLLLAGEQNLTDEIKILEGQEKEAQRMLARLKNAD